VSRCLVMTRRTRTPSPRPSRPVAARRGKVTSAGPLVRSARPGQSPTKYVLEFPRLSGHRQQHRPQRPLLLPRRDQPRSRVRRQPDLRRHPPHPPSPRRRQRRLLLRRIRLGLPRPNGDVICGADRRRGAPGWLRRKGHGGRLGRALSRGQGRCEGWAECSGTVVPEAHGRGELPSVPGNRVDQAGQGLPDDILTDPGSTTNPVTSGRTAGGTRIIRPDGTGVTFNPDGSLAYCGRHP
jgi:hypothetical protein